MKTLGEIADFIGGEVRGDASVSVTRIVQPAIAQGDSDLAFVLSPKEASVLESGRIVNAVVPAGIEGVPTAQSNCGEPPEVGLGQVNATLRTARERCAGDTSLDGD